MTGTHSDTVERQRKPHHRGPRRPYQRRTSLIRFDRRTVEGRLLDQVRSDLLAHLAAPPSITQLALVERATMLHLRIAQLDQRMLNGTMTGYDQNAYLAWVNAYRRTLQALGLGPERTEFPPPNI